MGGDRLGKRRVVILKIRGGEAHGLNRLAPDLVDLHRFFEQPAGVEGVQPKGNALFLPARLFGSESNPLVSVVIKIGEEPFDRLRGRIGRLRQVPHVIDQIVECEGGGRHLLRATAQRHQRGGKGRG